ncbi:dihydropteroate synthase [Leptospira fletcheri]|nr:dihydropteroate synthase [Leptospira fletcheri]
MNPRIGMRFPPKPQIFGVLNITSDSFSDGGRYLDPDLAFQKALSLVQEGADVVDIGAQSSNVEAGWVEPETEWERMKEIILELKNRKITVSVDTFKPYVIEKALQAGVDFINNIRAFTDAESGEILRKFPSSRTKYVVMYSHNHGDKAKQDSPLSRDTVLREIVSFFRERKKTLEGWDVAPERIVYDPGMGFFLSPDPMVSFSVLSSVTELLSEFPGLMVSVTRKSFLGNALGGIPVEERDIPTAICELSLWLRNVPMIRTHSPSKLLQAIRTWKLSNGEDS